MTPYDPDRHHRRSIRLRGYDYARAGAYFVTLVVQGRQCLFGRVADGAMCPNAAGEMIRRVWRDLPARFPGIRLDALAVMPNHVHGIIVLAPPDDAGDGAADDVSAGDWAATASPHAVRDDVAVGDGAGDDVSAGDWAAAASSHDVRGAAAAGNWAAAASSHDVRGGATAGDWAAAASPHDVRGGATAGDWAAAASSHDVRGGATVEDWAATRAAPTGNGVRGADPVGAPLVGAQSGYVAHNDESLVGAQSADARSADAQSGYVAHNDESHVGAQSGYVAHNDESVVGAQSTDMHAVGAHPADAQPADAQSIDAHLAGAPPHAAPHPAPTLGAVVGAFKSLATVEYARGVEAEGWPAFEGRLWQRNYYEQIIRDEAMWVQARRYIHDNAAHWPEDQENPEKAAP